MTMPPARQHAISEAIANADAHLNNAVLPTYTEAIAMLRFSLAVIEEARTNYGDAVRDNLESDHSHLETFLQRLPAGA